MDKEINDRLCDQRAEALYRLIMPLCTICTDMLDLSN